jgi:hypothetical protein
VTFDSVVRDSSRWHWGTVRTNPDYDATRADDPGDLGVVLFDEPVTDVRPASLPTEALFSQLGRGVLGETTFTSVGYGVSRTTGGADGGGPPTFDRSSGGTRKLARLGFHSLTPGWLHLAAQGHGELCTGDSGSPALLGHSDVITAILAVIPSPCGRERQVSWHQRLDTPSARTFLSQHVPLP